MQRIKHFETTTESELIERIGRGEKELYEILIGRNNPFLYKIGISYGYAHEDVEDLMQETFIAAYLSISKFEGRSSFKTWIARIMLNHCFQRSRKSSFRNEKPTDLLSNDKTILMFEEYEPSDTYHTVLNKELSHIIGA